MAIERLAKPNPPRKVTRGESFARRAVELLEGSERRHNEGCARATEMRWKGSVNEAQLTRLLDHAQSARQAVRIADIVGIDGGTGIAFIDGPRKQAWLRKRIATLSAARKGIEPDRPLSWGNAIVYRVTGGPRSGACYQLYLHHDTCRKHYAKMLEEARYYLEHGLEREARELLCRERDRCVTYSFRSGEQVEPL